MSGKPVAVVVGAGVIGMTCAIRLLEQGWEVHVVSKDRPLMTVSVGAGAIWEYPPFKIEPQEKAKQWALESLDVFERLSLQQSATGVYLRRTNYLYRDKAHFPQGIQGQISDAVRDFRTGVPPEAGPDFVAGYSYLTPVVAMGVYLDWLELLVEELGGKFHWGAKLARIGDAASAVPGRTAHLVVNASGLGAGALCGDAGVFGVRGSSVTVRCPEVLHVYSDESFHGPNGELTYISPKPGGVVACSGCADPNSTDTTVPEAEARAIVDRCAALVPALKGAKVLGAWVGFRPCRRDGVRLELEQGAAGSAPVIHNYGHGGSGVVVSWGTAEEVAKMAERVAAGAGLRLARTPLPAAAAAGLQPLGTLGRATQHRSRL